MFYVLFTLIALYTLCTLAFAITSFGERCARAGVLGSILFLIMLGLLGLYGKAEASGLLSGTAAQVSQGIIALILLLSIVARGFCTGSICFSTGKDSLEENPPEGRSRHAHRDGLLEEMREPLTRLLRALGEVKPAARLLEKAFWPFIPALPSGHPAFSREFPESLSEFVLDGARSVDHQAGVDQGLDGQVKADEEENSIGSANKQRSSSAEASIQETAVNVKGV